MALHRRLEAWEIWHSSGDLVEYEKDSKHTQRDTCARTHTAVNAVKGLESSGGEWAGPQTIC